MRYVNQPIHPSGLSTEIHPQLDIGHNSGDVSIAAMSGLKDNMRKLRTCGEVQISVRRVESLS
jgi:hypothetical protein